MKFKPTDDRILVEPNEVSTTTPGGIVIPDRAKGVPQRGTVLAVGDGRALPDGGRMPVAVGVGDEVIFAEYAGTQLEIDGVKVLVIREGELLGWMVK